jgi:hypothetical protein
VIDERHLRSGEQNEKKNSQGDMNMIVLTGQKQTVKASKDAM